MMVVVKEAGWRLEAPQALSDTFKLGNSKNEYLDTTAASEEAGIREVIVN
jgi:hypothetical protein